MSARLTAVVVMLIAASPSTHGLRQTVANGAAYARYAAVPDDFSPTWSPDGSRLVFARRIGQDIKLFQAAIGSQEPPKRFFDDAYVYTQPDWSPDGARVACSSNRSGRSQIWTMAADGSDLRQVTDLATGPNVQPRWSPDGKQIVFVAYPGQRIMIVAAGGGAPRQVATGVWPAWSPDGKRIAFGAASLFETATRMAVKNLDTGEQTRRSSPNSTRLAPRSSTT